MTSNKHFARLGFDNRVRSGTRRKLTGLLGLGLLAPLIACGNGRKSMKTEAVLNVVVHSYIDRPILDILFNGNDLGVSGAFGGTGTITGVRVPFGPQKLTWRLDGAKGMPRLGETVTAKNQLVVREQDIGPDTRYIGLHLYQDETAEISFSEYIPELSTRGEEIMRKKRG
jgi:hypothetical protein